MKISNIKDLKPKSLIVFDLDGTLARTKAPMDATMSSLISRLLAIKKVAIIGGGTYAIFKTQFLAPLRAEKVAFENLFLFPTTATSFYRYRRGWKNVYALRLSPEEKRQIKNAFGRVFAEIGYTHPQKTYGKIIEDRSTQITFSALGQDVVAILGKNRGAALKEKWLEQNRELKMNITKRLARMLPDFEVRAAGFTSIDVTKKGIDKGYGLRQIDQYVHCKIRDMLFIGDAIFPGGNDYAIIKTGVDYIPVTGPHQTKDIIRTILREKGH